MQYISQTPCPVNINTTVTTLITLECDPTGVDGVSYVSGAARVAAADMMGAGAENVGVGH